MDRIKCLILDSIEDDYSPIWDIISMFNRNLNIEDGLPIDIELIEALNYLLTNRLISVFYGSKFEGEEVELLDFVLTEEFIDKHREDWIFKRAFEMDHQFIITKKGVEKLKECDPEYF